MKKKLFIGILTLISFSINAQLAITNQGNGIVDITYGDTDYSLFDPAGNTEIYLYLWVDEAQTNPVITQQYNDDWNDATSLVVLNWDANVNQFTGSINFNTHDFIGEGVLPQNTTLSDFNLVLRDLAGDAATQSDDLIASDYGFNPTTTTASVNQIEFQNKNIKLFPTITNDFFKINSDVIELDIVSFSGKKIATFKGDFNSDYSFNISNLAPATYFVKIKTLKGQNVQKLIVK